MGVLDKVISAVTPEASDNDKMEARLKARALAGTSGWLAMVLDHHQQIETAFAAVKDASSETGRRAAQKSLALILNGHSLAEEVVLYPAMALTDQKGHSGAAYTEQSAAKVQMAALEEIPAMSQDYLDKLEHIRAAVSHHVYEEESEWFPELRKHDDAAMQSKLTRRYREEFDRYVGSSSN